MSDEVVLYQVDGAIARITLNRPEKEKRSQRRVDRRPQASVAAGKR